MKKIYIIIALLSLSFYLVSSQETNIPQAKKALVQTSLSAILDLNKEFALLGFHTNLVVPTKIEDLYIDFGVDLSMNDNREKEYGGGAFVGVKTFKGNDKFGLLASTSLGYFKYRRFVEYYNYRQEINGLVSISTIGIYYGNEKIKISPNMRIMIAANIDDDKSNYIFIGPELSTIFNF